jgi:hypothetical protein
MTPEMTATEVAPATASEAQKPRDRRGGLPFALVFSVFATLLALGIGLGFTIHKSYVGFERAAARHVPPDATLVARWDVEKVSLFEPTRRFLLPLIDQSSPGHRAPPARRDRFAKQSGAVLGRDLREVLATFGPRPGDWSVLLAGSFPAGDLVAAAQRTLSAEGIEWRSVAPGRIAAPSGVALGQGADGVLVLASSVARLDASLAVHPLLPEVPRVGAGSLLLRGSSGGLPPGGSELLAALGSPDEIRAEAQWATPMPIRLDLHFAGSPPPDMTERVRRALSSVFGEDLIRLERQYAPVAIQPAGNRAFRVDLLLDDTALERVANRAAGTVERELGLGPAQD